MSLISRSVITPTTNITRAPIKYTVVWNWSKKEMMNRNPRATGISIAPNPRAKTSVRNTTRLRSLKIVPKYEGNRNVIQQGANSATIPPTKAATKEMPAKRLVPICYFTFAFTENVSSGVFGSLVLTYTMRVTSPFTGMMLG